MATEASKTAKKAKSRDNRRRLVTPEGVDLGVIIGDSGQRIGAFVIDMIVMIVGMIALSILAAYAAVTQEGGEMVSVIWLLGFFLIRNFYFIAMELRPRAATLGKHWMRLRVVARDGGRLTADAVVARNLMREVETFLPLTMLVTGLFAGKVDALTGWLGFIWTGVFLCFPLLNKDRLRVGDLLAGTWVIRTTRDKLDRDLSTLPTLAAFVFTHEQLDAYGVYELETLEGVLRRSESAAKLTVAQAIIDKIGWPVEVTDIDGFLMAYYTQLRARLETRLLLGKRRADKFDVVA
jgi:uncharacterized RDD family membrane protein YckC